jgi:hypothetical protein
MIKLLLLFLFTTLSFSQKNGGSKNSIYGNENNFDSNKIEHTSKIQNQLDSSSQPASYPDTLHYETKLSTFILKDNSEKFAEFLFLKHDTIFFNAKVNDTTIQSMSFHKSFFKKIILPNQDLVPLIDSFYPAPKGVLVEATLTTKSGLQKDLDFLALVRDTLYLSGEFENGKTHMVTLPKKLFSQIIFDSGDTLDLSLSDFHFNTIPKFKVPIVLPKPIIRIETAQEGSQLFIDKKFTKYTLPCTIELDSGTHLFQSYWSVAENSWGGEKSIHLIPGDSIKIYLKNEPTSPSFLLNSNPTAEVFFSNQSPEKNYSSISTPWESPKLEPGNLDIQLYAPGFKDTTISIFVSPTGFAEYNVNLLPDTSLARENFNNKRSLLAWKNGFLGLSLAQLTLSAIFYYSAMQDFQEAQGKLDILKSPLVHKNGNGVSELKASNNKSFRNGQNKEKLALSLFMTSILSFGIAWTF